MNKLIAGLVLSVLLSGCTPHMQVMQFTEQANEKAYQDRSPVRQQIQAVEGGYLISTSWAGSPGNSVVPHADEILQQDIWRQFEQGCGFTPEDLKEVRVVEHRPPSFFYEVWIFNDEQSKRADKTSGLSLVLSMPASGGTDIRIVGQCSKNAQAEKAS